MALIICSTENPPIIRSVMLLTATLLIIALPLAALPSSAAEPASSQTLPFDPLPYDQLVNGEHKVFAHYFTAFPISLDNLDPQKDYYTRHYLNPDGEGGRYSAQGGYLRARPLPRAVDRSDNWQLADMRREVRLAKAIGLDGFAVDLLDFEGMHFKRARLMLDAAQLEGEGFKILLMPDMNAALESQPERLVPMLQELSRHPAALRLDDKRLVVSPYLAQRQAPAWWEEKLDVLKQQGIDVAFIPLFHGWLRHFGGYAKFSYGVSDWGGRSPSTASQAYWTGMAGMAQSWGKLWMAPVAPQDVRPKNSSYWEAGNSEMFRKQWMAAIYGGADWVHLITWNDYSEHTAIAPNTAAGYAFYDLSAYYITWFKTGHPPPIVRDAIYAFHRIHATSAPPRKRHQPTLMQAASNSVTPRNQIEMLAFLTSAATLEIDVGGSIDRKEFAAGLVRFVVPLRPGTPIFRIRRNGKVIASVQGEDIRSGIAIQDMQYHGAGSLR